MKPDELQSKLDYARLARNYNPLHTTWHMLYDPATRRPLATSTVLGSINGLAQKYKKATVWHNMHRTLNKFGKIRIDANFKPANCWEYQFNLDTRFFDYNIEELTPDQIYYHHLATEKAAAIDKLIGVINDSRRPFVKDLIDQNYIYELKRNEALEFLSLGDESAVDDRYGFVKDHSEIARCSMFVAAQDIVNKGNHQRLVYRQSEKIRLKYFQAILNASEIVDLNATISDLEKEMQVFVKL
jgi:hypothetical protein